MSRTTIFDPPRRRSDRRQLLRIIRSSLVRTASLTEDGRTITNYIDGHRFLGDPTALHLCCDMFLDVIRTTPARAVVGEVSAACALVSGIILRGHDRGRPLVGRYLRKKSKDYGIRGRLNTPLPPGAPVFIVDDVTSTGLAAERCVVALREEGFAVCGVMAVVDRNEGSRPRLSALDVDLWALFTLKDLEDPGEEGVGHAGA